MTVASEPPSVPRILALKNNRQVTEVKDGETLDVECTVERVYPVHNLKFQLISGETLLMSSSDPGTISTNKDGTFRASKVFSVIFSSSYSSTEDGLMCKADNERGDNQSGRLLVAACE